MEKWKEKMLNELLDLFIERNGILWTINWLLGLGYTKEQLLELRFDPEDIELEEEKK